MIIRRLRRLPVSALVLLVLLLIPYAASGHLVLPVAVWLGAAATLVQRYRSRDPQDERPTERILSFCYGDHLGVFIVCMILLLAVLYLIADRSAHSYNGACGGD